MSDTPQPEPKPKLRWYQYRLGSLFVLLTVAAIVCGWIRSQILRNRRQKESAEAIVEFANDKFGGGAIGVVVQDYWYRGECSFDPTAQPDPSWLQDYFGVDIMPDVVCVNLFLTEATDADLAKLREHLENLPELQALGLHGTRITDVGLQHLENLKGLQYLELGDTEIGDAGLKHLMGMTNLEKLRLDDTQVSDDGIKELQQALPNCRIFH